MNFEKICRQVVKKFSPFIDMEKFEERIKKNLSEEFLDSIVFTGIDLEPHEIIFFSYVISIFTLIFAIITSAILIMLSKTYFTFMAVICIVILFPLLTLHFLSEYPKAKARQMKILSLGDMPEVIGYIVMYLKLIPNLENAIRFAARESKTTLGKYLRKILWDIEIRVYRGIDDAITSFADTWGKWSEHFRRAIHLIRSSVHERNRGERNITLDRSMDVILDGMKSMMMDFSNKLHQPTLIIYSIGVMMPLALVAMMPAISMLKTLRVSEVEIFVFYDVILPLLLFYYIRKILLSRPAAFAPVDISSGSIFSVKLKNFFVACAGGIACFVICIIMEQMIKTYFPPSLIILLSFGISAGIYLWMTYQPYKILRDEIREMENEFGDALYILGKRIMEGKPSEEAFMYASHTFKKSRIGDIFARISFNLVSMRMSTEDALFDREFGALTNVPSSRIKAIMKLFVEGIKKSYAAAGVAVIKIADHLKQLQEVEKRIRNTLGVLTSTLKTTANVFAPIIAGITLGITKLMANVMGKIGNGEILSISGLNPDYFVFAIGIYLIELVFLLNRLANGIEDGDDKIYYFYSLGKSLPYSMLIFTVSTVLSTMFFNNISPV